MNTLHRLFLLCLLLGWSAGLTAAIPKPPLRILVLHSYDASYQWTQDTQLGIETAIAQLSRRVDQRDVLPSVEYLDTKRIESEEYYRLSAKYLKAKYQNLNFDGVIVTDDSALHFYANYLVSSWPNAPVMAVGINNANAPTQNLPSGSQIIYERDQVEATLKMMLALKPRMKRLYYLADRSVTSNLIYQVVRAEMANYPNVDLVEIRDLPLAEAVAILQQASENDAVLLTHYNTEVDVGIFHSYQHIAAQVANNSQAPVFVLWELYLNEPMILGGFVNRSREFGYQAVFMLLSQLGVDTFYDHTPNNYNKALLNYPALQQHQINQRLLPESSEVIKLPTSYFYENRRLIGGAVIVFLFLTCIIVMQFLSIRQRKELEIKNRKIVVLQKRMLNTQKEMIHVLGEAIETRSGETGNHVKRVAKISAKLAELMGLSHREIELIEIISPMHDVGKIAVPESILDKPSKLSQAERTIMQQHTVRGYQMLAHHNGKITQLAAIIALQHHERWDGRGYPNQLEAEEIHLFARITAVADVFDALLSQRCYKSAWPIDKVCAFFAQEKGRHFDPRLCDLLLEHLDAFIELRAQYPDKIQEIADKIVN